MHRLCKLYCQYKGFVDKIGFAMGGGRITYVVDEIMVWQATEYFGRMCRLPTNKNWMADCLRKKLRVIKKERGSERVRVIQTSIFIARPMALHFLIEYVVAWWV